MPITFVSELTAKPSIGTTLIIIHVLYMYMYVLTMSLMTIENIYKITNDS